MPTRPTRDDRATWVDLHPLGAGGLDYHSNQAVARPDTFVTGESIRLDTGALDRRKGDAKIYRASAPTANPSKTGGTDAKYITIPAATQLQIPEGGFAVMFHITAAWSGAGLTGYALSSRVNGEAFHILSITMSDAGVVTVDWTKNSDSSSVSIATSALTDDADTHLLAVFDAVAGTFTVYVNGVSDGTPVTGISSTEKPFQGAGTAWHCMAHYDPATAGVVANTHFDGAMEGFTLISLRGQRVADGVASFTSMLLRHSLRIWPLPYADYVLACYDMSDTGTSVYDRSRYENTATAEAGVSDSPAVANGVIITNHVGHVQRPDGTRTNVIGSSGRLFYEDVA